MVLSFPVNLFLFAISDWCRNYRHRSRGVYWSGKPGTGNGRVHEPARWFGYRKNNVVA